MDDYQGKRPKQVLDSEEIAFWALAFLILSIFTLLFSK